MKVRYEGEAGQGTQVLRAGATYAVLEVLAVRGKVPGFRIDLGPGELPAVFDSTLFTVSSPDMPPFWQVSITSIGFSGRRTGGMAASGLLGGAHESGGMGLGCLREGPASNP
ncbi:hypothetical protein FHU37_004181 [Allostreptomyces psammosilenae]|uniref:Uncharacterized protein n=1 Tax=Allostreptomyces psammosilenae TaxID=1892865 RepID=A0A853A9Q5_9ACTN|nr:hypothetical protein [Allostreptomyces psammosilenae]